MCKFTHSATTVCTARCTVAAFASACFFIKMKNRLRDVDYGLLYKQSTFLTMIGL